MKCHGPLHGWYSKDRTAAGKRKVVFDFSEAYADMPVDVPCGQCAGCLLERARQWAVRCVHEASLWESNVFVTLTYSAAEVPMVGGLCTLRPRDFVLFMKRLRKTRDGVRFFQAGEYGSLGRPHHHVLLFNCGFPDRVFLRGEGKSRLYRSRELESLWPYGFSSIGEVTFESAGYVARYTLKKQLFGVPGSDRRFPVTMSPLDREGSGRIGEYVTMSRRPGIGAGWYEKFGREVFPSDELIVRGGFRMKPPRFYEERFGRENPKALREVKRKRMLKVDPEESSRARMEAKREISAAKRRLYEERKLV